MERGDLSEWKLTLFGFGYLRDYVLELLSSLGTPGPDVVESPGLGDLQSGLDCIVVETRADERRSLIEAIEKNGLPVAVGLVHPRAWVGLAVSIGGGSVVLSGAQLVTHISVGRHCVVGPNAVISHDCRLGTGVTVAAGALLNGNVTVEDFATIGSGAVITPGLRVGQGAVVEAGSVVIVDVDAGARVGGCPARPVMNDYRDG